MSFAYHLWSHRLVSEFDLGELEPASDSCGPGGSIHIHRSSEADWPQLKGQSILEIRLDDGDLWLSSSKSENGYVLHFPDLCSFRIRPSEMRIDCDPAPGIAESTIAHLILDHAIPRLLSLTPGFMVFHASAIRIENQVVAVLGQSGQGKSTLAAWFAARGFPLLTDDCLVVRWDEAAGQWLAQPSYPSVRLWPDSVDALAIPESELREFAGYSLKKRTGREVDFRFASAGAPLTACFVLRGASQGDETEPVHSGPPELRPLSVNESFLALAGAVFRIAPDDPQVNRREFEVLTSLTATVRFWDLNYERQYRSLPDVQDVIIKAVQSKAHESAERKLP